METEVLVKIVYVIHEIYEAGLEPTFWGQTVTAV